jgi:large subunit ribosomal protein L9
MSKTTKMKKQRRQPKGFSRLPTGKNGGVELLLIQTVEHVGKHGDVVEVRPGFAKNYLIPNGLATLATDHHKRMVEKHKEKLEQIARAKLKSWQDLARQIEKLSLAIEANVNEEGHLYGSVGATEIADALRKNEFTIAAEQIRMEGVLKELGLYTVKVRLHPEVTADLKVWVVPSADTGETASAQRPTEPGNAAG